MVARFRHKGQKRLYERGDASGIRPDLRTAVEEIQTTLDAADSPRAMNLPGYRLHALKGDLKGFWSVMVRANWRVIFRFEGEDVVDVELIDYH
jgi:proteic killer suppression protein